MKNLYDLDYLNRLFILILFHFLFVKKNEKLQLFSLIRKWSYISYENHPTYKFIQLLWLHRNT